MMRFPLMCALIACPATLLSQPRVKMKNPAVGRTTTATNSSFQHQRWKVVFVDDTGAQPPVNTAQQDKIDTQRRAIREGMSEARQRYNRAMDTAHTNMATGVAPAAATMGGAAGGVGISRSINPAAKKTLDNIQRQMRPCPTC